MITNYCCIADKNFLTRWMALYKSLSDLNLSFRMWVLCLDDEAYAIITKYGSNVSPITLNDIGDRELDRVRHTRKPNEFAWTCKPLLMLFVARHSQPQDILIYVDADMCFYSSPLASPEMTSNDYSILITPHRFPLERSGDEKIKGRYNAGLIVFKNNETSTMCLKRWREQCLEWCFQRFEDGRLADQMYLDEWPVLYPGVKEAGVAWNLGSWNSSDNHLYHVAGAWLVNDEPLICFHFHGLKVYLTRNGSLKAYPVTVYHAGMYREYISRLSEAQRVLMSMDMDWKHGTAPHPGILRILKQEALKILRL